MNAERSKNASSAAPRTALTLDISRGRMPGGRMSESSLCRLAERNPVSFEVQNGELLSVLERSPAGGISCVVHVAVLVTNRSRYRVRPRSLFIQDQPVASDTQYQTRF